MRPGPISDNLEQLVSKLDAGRAAAPTAFKQPAANSQLTVMCTEFAACFEVIVVSCIKKRRRPLSTNQTTQSTYVHIGRKTSCIGSATNVSVLVGLGTERCGQVVSTLPVNCATWHLNKIQDVLCLARYLSMGSRTSSRGRVQ